MRRILAVILCMLLAYAPSLALTIANCKAGTYHDCSTNSSPPDWSSVTFHYTSCATGQHRVTTIFSYWTSCWTYEYTCYVEAEGYEKVICNTCTQSVTITDYFCNAC